MMINSPRLTNSVRRAPFRPELKADEINEEEAVIRRKEEKKKKY